MRLLLFLFHLLTAPGHSMMRTNSTELAACVMDASNLIKGWQGCTQAPWAFHAAESYGAIRPANDTEPVIVINVGANKGYNVVSFATLWSNALWQRLDPQAWQKAILAYANGQGDGNRKRYLNYKPDGACHETSGKYRLRHQQQAHRRERTVHVHLLELLPSNRQLLRWLINFTRLSDVAFVHDYAISNATYLAPEPAGSAGYETVSLKDGAFANRVGARWGQNKRTIQVLTLDEFMLRQRLDEVWAVVIDAEGYDALVLEGMRRVLGAHRVVFVEFEYHSIGYWGSAVPLSERRSLKATQQWLGALGYTCFMEAWDTVAPISGPCWMDAFETRQWSNVVCTHRAELLYNMSEQSYIERLSRRAPVRPEAGATLKD